MKTKITIPSNDVWSDMFESKMDEHFTSRVQAYRYGQYQRLDKDGMRTALATKRPLRSKFWAKGKLGIRSPVTKD